MATTIAMPKLGLTMQEGTVVRWLKAPGDAVAENEPVCEIVTDKSTNEVESPVAGVLLQILVAEDETVPCQTPLCLVGAAGETTAAAPAAAATAPAPAVAVPAGTAGGRVRISPAARKMARTAGIDYTRLVGTGPSGRVVMADVDKAALAAAAPLAVAGGEGIAANAGATVAAAAPAVTEVPVPLTPMRRVIAQRMTASLRESAQLTLSTTVDAGALVAFRQWLISQCEDALGFRIGYNEVIVRAVALALAQQPEIAVTWTEAGIVRREGVHVGVAVDVPGGLLVPVLRHADRLGLAELHRQLANLAERARSGKLSSADLEGGTITVSNLGHFGVEAFTPILNPPEAAILGVGAVRAVPVVRDGSVVPGHELTLSLTIDHRLIDGAPGARFLSAIRDLLEHPARLAV